MAKILVCDAIDEKCINTLKELGYEVHQQTGMDEATLIEKVPPYHAMIVRSATKVTAKVIAAAENLKVVLRGGVGIDNIDSEAAKEHDVHVRNTPAASSHAVAELALTKMFALAGKYTLANASMQAGKWEKKKFKGTELAGKVLGLIGSGRIGSEVARLASALGMSVIAYDPYVTTFEFGTLVDSKEDVFKTADYISLHLPFNESTANIVSKEMIDLMKPTAFLIQCARGGVVDEAAFAAAAREGKVGGGAFDVFADEPLGDSPLRGIDNIILTPHIGASTKEAQARIGDELVEIIKEELPL
ncbi:MAG: hydroxyacid dehydrogenase [Planctomycetota bacterium]|nr:hydroxyacid dehydrogenase [Planctomycetota bacterium]